MNCINIQTEGKFAQTQINRVCARQKWDTSIWKAHIHLSVVLSPTLLSRLRSRVSLAQLHAFLTDLENSWVFLPDLGVSELLLKICSQFLHSFENWTHYAHCACWKWTEKKKKIFQVKICVFQVKSVLPCLGFVSQLCTKISETAENRPYLSFWCAAFIYMNSWRSVSEVHG